MKSVGSCGSSSLLFMMKVKVRHFVGDSHKGYDRLIVVSPSNCCCGDFSAISYIYMYVCMPMVRYIDGTLSSTYLRSINWQWLTCTILESLYQFHLAEGCKWSSSLTTMWMGTSYIDLPIFASNHHMVHWEGWRLGDKSWYLVWRKSKVFQFKFDLALPSVTPFQGTTMWTETFFYWSPNVCIQSSLWCIGKEEDWATSHDTLSEGSQK
jgi:hypothetical protein